MCLEVREFLTIESSTLGSSRCFFPRVQKKTTPTISGEVSDSMRSPKEDLLLMLTRLEKATELLPKYFDATNSRSGR